MKFRPFMAMFSTCRPGTTSDTVALSVCSCTAVSVTSIVSVTSPSSSSTSMTARSRTFRTMPVLRKDLNPGDWTSTV